MMCKKVVFPLLMSLPMLLLADDFGEIARKNWSMWHNNPPEIFYPQSYSQKKINARRKFHLDAIKQFAPHWLDEFAAVDRAMGWKAGTYAETVVFGINFKKSLPPAPHECTSWIVMPDLTGGKYLMLHKNRDSKSRYMMALRRSAPGKYSWIGYGNFAHIGVNSGINSRALAVAMNSGDKTMENNTMGLSTPEIARILLEECADAPSAVKLLEKIIASGVYYHGQSGSMWVIADAKNAFVVEHNAKHFHAQPVTRGMAIRANAWHFPEMLAYSRRQPADIVSNGRREYAVRKALLTDLVQKGKVITPADMSHASRISKLPEDPKCYPLCGKNTNAATTFVIDQEFPENLSYALFSFGPPRHTFYIPVPITVKNFPAELNNGSFYNEVFRRYDRGKWKEESELQAVEAKLNSNFTDAVERARAVLKSGKAGAEKEAAAILEASFRQNWQIAVAAGEKSGSK